MRPPLTRESALLFAALFGQQDVEDWLRRRWTTEIITFVDHAVLLDSLCEKEEFGITLAPMSAFGESFEGMEYMAFHKLLLDLGFTPLIVRDLSADSIPGRECRVSVFARESVRDIVVADFRDNMLAEARWCASAPPRRRFQDPAEPFAKGQPSPPSCAPRLLAGDVTSAFALKIELIDIKRGTRSFLPWHTLDPTGQIAKSHHPMSRLLSCLEWTHTLYPDIYGSLTWPAEFNHATFLRRRAMLSPDWADLLDLAGSRTFAQVTEAGLGREE